MQALDLITCAVTGGGGAQTNVPPIGGDSLTVRQFSPSFKARLIAVHVLNLFSEQVRLLSPRLHDNSVGITFQAHSVTGGFSLLPIFVRQHLESLDQLRLSLLSSVNQVTVLLSVLYDDLPVTKTRYIDHVELERRCKQVRSIPYSSAAIAFNTYGDQASLSDHFFKAEKDYAVLGFQGEGTEGFMRIKVAETGKLSIGFPAFSQVGENQYYFPALSQKFGRKLVPVVSGENISTGIVESIGFTNVNGLLFFAELE